MQIYAAKDFIMRLTLRDTVKNNGNLNDEHHMYLLYIVFIYILEKTVKQELNFIDDDRDND